MVQRKYEPTRDTVVRIEAIDLASEHEKGHGLYRWQHMTDNYLLDIVSLKKEIGKVVTGRIQIERIMDRIANFRKVYIDLTTGEVTS